MNWEEVINRDDIDIVDIVTPTYIHKDMAVAAAIGVTVGFAFLRRAVRRAAMRSDRRKK